MRFWIDASTPKEVLFFKVIYKELQRRNHEVMLTTRHAAETNDLMRYHSLDAEVIGTHGTSGRKEKLKLGVLRLTKLYNRFCDEEIDGTIMLTNPEVCRVAFGLGFPVFNFIDIPEAEIVCKLTLPLSTGVFIPFHVKEEQIRRYWQGEKLFTYNTLDPVAYMSKGLPRNVDELGLDEKYFDRDHLLKRPFILYRVAETKATYFDGYSDFTNLVINQLKNRLPNATFFEVPRYKRHKIVDLQSLTCYADLFIGGGGTITEEAAYWGTWSISCRPIRTTYDSWLIQTGNLYHPDSVDEAVDLAISLLKNKIKNPYRFRISDQVFPLKEICDTLEEWGGYKR